MESIRVLTLLSRQETHATCTNFPWRFRLEQALIPVAIGLTVGSGLLIAERNEHAPSLWIVTAAAAAILAVSRLNPLLVLAAGGLLGWLFPAAP